MKIHILVDNNLNAENDFLTEHGISIYFEADGYKWLFDVGASDLYYINAKKMDIAIEEVDYLVISHGHIDHAGGLSHFLSVNSKATILLSSEIIGKSYFSYRRNLKRNISLNLECMDQCIERFIFIEKSKRITDHVEVITGFNNTFSKPKANESLYIVDSKKEAKDDFRHELALMIHIDRGLIVFSGCSHNGILNILETCATHHPKKNILACIGGTHLRDGDSENSYESINELQCIGKLFLEVYPTITLFTGHCTGMKAANELSRVMGNQIEFFFSGETISL